MTFSCFRHLDMFLLFKGEVAAQVRPRPADLEKALRSGKLAYHSQCDLLVFQQHQSGAHHFKGGHGKGRFKKSKADNSSDEETGKAVAASVFLQIQYASCSSLCLCFCVYHCERCCKFADPASLSFHIVFSFLHFTVSAAVRIACCCW